MHAIVALAIGFGLDESIDNRHLRPESLLATGAVAVELSGAQAQRRRRGAGTMSLRTGRAIRGLLPVLAPPARRSRRSGHRTDGGRPVRVLLADDHGIVRRGLKGLVEHAGLRVVAEAADGLEAIRLIEQHRPDLAILDIGMPRLNGIDVTRRSQKLVPPPAVVILSMHTDESYIVHALAAGARAYLIKDATDEDLLPAVRAVTAGRHYFSRAVTSLLAEDYVQTLQTRGATDSYHLLTDREREVLHLLAEGRSNRDVAALLGLGQSTVETHRSNLMVKLNLHNTAEIVLYAVRKGLVIGPDGIRAVPRSLSS